MADDDILAGLAGVSGGIREILVPIMQQRFRQNAEDESFLKRRKLTNADQIALLEKEYGLKAPQLQYERDTKTKELGLREREVGAKELTAKALAEKAKGTAGKGDLLTVQESLALGVPYGTPKRDAYGLIPKTQTDKNKLEQFSAANAIIDQIENVSGKVNTFKPGKFGQEDYSVE